MLPHRCLWLCWVSVLALMPLVCPSWLLCCLLSSAASHLVAPPCVHLSLSPHLSLCSSSLWCARLLSTPAVCRVNSSYAAASHLPVPLLLIAPPPLIAPLSCLLSGWLSHCLSLRQHLLSISTYNSRRAIVSSCAPLVPLIHSGWSSCSQQHCPKWTHSIDITRICKPKWNTPLSGW